MSSFDYEKSRMKTKKNMEGANKTSIEARAANAQQLDPIGCKNPAPFGEQKKKSRNLYQSFC